MTQVITPIQWDACARAEILYGYCCARRDLKLIVFVVTAATAAAARRRRGY